MIELGAVITVVALVCAGCFNGGHGAPAIYVSPAVQLLGTVNPSDNEEISARFHLHNTTSKPLRITKTMTSCGCTEIKVGRHSIPPGDTVEIVMRIRTKGLFGQQKISAQIWTDNSAYPYFDLSAAGDFTGHGTISPYDVTLPFVTPSELVCSHSY